MFRKPLLEIRSEGLDVAFDEQGARGEGCGQQQKEQETEARASAVARRASWAIGYRCLNYGRQRLRLRSSLCWESIPIGSL